LLFDFSRGLFAGWLRGLALVAIGSLGLTLLLSMQIAVMEPWISDVLERRSLGYATPAAPTEMLALVTGFAIATACLMILLTRVAFQNAWPLRRPWLSAFPRADALRWDPAAAGAGSTVPIHSRAATIGETLTNQIRREESRIRKIERVPLIGPSGREEGPSTGSNSMTAPAAPLGSSYRRTTHPTSRSQKRRDNRG